MTGGLVKIDQRLLFSVKSPSQRPDRYSNVKETMAHDVVFTNRRVHHNSSLVFLAETALISLQFFKTRNVNNEEILRLCNTVSTNPLQEILTNTPSSARNNGASLLSFNIMCMHTLYSWFNG